MDTSDHFNIYGMQMWKENFSNTFKSEKFEAKVLFLPAFVTNANSSIKIYWH